MLTTVSIGALAFKMIFCVRYRTLKCTNRCFNELINRINHLHPGIKFCNVVPQFKRWPKLSGTNGPRVGHILISLVEMVRLISDLRTEVARNLFLVQDFATQCASGKTEIMHVNDVPANKSIRSSSRLQLSLNV